ncbi:MAG: hypothetical protein KAS49_02530, partial [Candidatus Cloacimonetes bacterium]|nr:hypothetical protein [Candidatus Cloacimonadota bacterium]
MTITISNNEKFYSFESNPDLLEQALEDTLTKSKLFPLSFDQLFKQISKKINTQKKKRVELAIHKLKQNGIIIMIETNYGPAYFCKKNEILVFNKFIAILQHFHKQFPHKSGITKSQIREFFSSNKKKKKQKSICPFLLNYIIQIAHKQQLINIAGNSLSIKGFVPRFESIEITLEILMELIMKNFDFKKSDKKEF